jgi:carbamate kinase
MKKLAMVAFGGNALLRAGEKGTFEEQLANVERTCGQLCHLVSRGYDIVIGHGNGPQVGNGLLRQEAGKKVFGLEAMPMDFCGAETQGSIAYLIETALDRVLSRSQDPHPVVSLVTRVEVRSDDPGFRNPTKPVGPYYKEPGADGATYRQDPAGRGWRKVVASPAPVRILNIDLVERLAREGYIVVTVGGGGIPVVRDADGTLRGVEAVIDKDLASALAAVTMKADEFYILTDVPKVYIHFHSPEQRALDTMTVAQARQYLSEGMFAEGSMAPKVRAGIYFVESGGGACVITEASELGNPACGTRIIP